MWPRSLKVRTQPFQGWDIRFKSDRGQSALVAQMGEQRNLSPEVVGSSPTESVTVGVVLKRLKRTVLKTVRS